MRERVTVVLVCGSHTSVEPRKVFNVLDAYKLLYGELLILHGAAPNTDSVAEQWAKSRQVIYIGVPAQWDLYGRSAGPHRNLEMLALFKPDHVIAFPGGPGTRNMIAQARSHGIEPYIP